MIRSEFIVLIVKALEGSGEFKATDFTINEESGGYGTKLVVTYRHHNEYFFSAEIPNDKTTSKTESGRLVSEYRILVRASPGGMTTLENMTVRGRDELLTEIRHWINSVYEDLGSMSCRRQFERQQDEINQLASKLGEVEDSYFSQEEADEIVARLEALEERMKASMQDSIQDKEQLSEKIAQLEKDMAGLRMQVDILKRPQWRGALIIRVLAWFKEPSNQKVLKSGAEAITNLLTDGKPHS